MRHSERVQNREKLRDLRMDNYTKKLQILQREDRTREIESAFETKFIPEIARK